MGVEEFSHNLALVLMSVLVALVAGFTGLSLTRSLARKTAGQKKVAVALASVALGGGIWSMHFVAMLGLQLPVLFYYDAAITLLSALTGILIVGGALIVLHFMERTPTTILSAGAMIGTGVLVMHYIGMAGLEMCRAVYSLPGVALSSVVAIALCMLAVWIAYNRRTNRNIFLGTVCFGAAVVSVHFLAMAGTQFVAQPQTNVFGPGISNEFLAIGVILTSFVIFGAFLWVSTTYLDPAPQHQQVASPTVTSPPDQPKPQTIPTSLQIPCEREGGKVFIPARDVSFIRADGHYTQLYTDRDRLFCVWPMTEAAKRLSSAGFLQTHRSYLINLEKVARFERSKDKGRCTFDCDTLPPVPVSRSKIKLTQELLAATANALRAD